MEARSARVIVRTPSAAAACSSGQETNQTGHWPSLAQLRQQRCRLLARSLPPDLETLDGERAANYARTSKKSKRLNPGGTQAGLRKKTIAAQSSIWGAIFGPPSRA